MKTLFIQGTHLKNIFFENSRPMFILNTNQF